MLVLRLQHPDDPEPAWALLNGASTDWANGSWDNVPPLAKGQPLVLLIPGRDVLLTHTTLNTRNQRQLQQAIPFALEESLADDTENQHIVWHPRSDSNQIDAAIIERERLRLWIAALAKRQLHASVILPDIFALPWDASTLTLWQQGNHVWLRTGELTGLSTTTAALPLVLTSLRANQPAPLRLRLYSDQPTTWANDEGIETIPELHAEKLHASSLQSGLPLNLLRGLADENRLQLRQQWQRWRFSAILVGVALTLGIAWQAIGNYQQQQQLDALNSENLRLFNELFPDAKATDPFSLKWRLDSELLRLQGNLGTSQSNSPLAALASFAEGFAGNNGITIEEIRAQQGNITISLQAKGQSAIDALRTTLENKLSNIELKSSRTADTIKATLKLGGSSP